MENGLPARFDKCIKNRFAFNVHLVQNAALIAAFKSSFIIWQKKNKYRWQEL